jgi:hypothetical protein
MKRTASERFWSKVNKLPGDGCWEWTAGRFSSGYAQFSVKDWPFRAHRWLWEELNGPIQDGLLVMHKCDNRICVRPDHLRLGTHADNMADRQAKCRGAFGRRNGRARLDEDDVRAIRASGETHGLVACAFGVSRSLVEKIRARDLWAHVV